MPAIKQSTSKETKEESANSAVRKTKKFFGKLVPHRKKTSVPPPTQVEFDANATPRVSNIQFNKQDQKPIPNTTTAVKRPKKKLKTSWLSRTKAFTKMSDSAFDIVDADGSGEVDEKELYSGLLLIHLKLGCYAGPAACRPGKSGKMVFSLC